MLRAAAVLKTAEAEGWRADLCEQHWRARRFKVAAQSEGLLISWGGGSLV